MTDREEKVLETLKQSKKYREISGEAVERVFLEELPKHKNLKDANKAARAQLHQMASMYVEADRTQPKLQALMEAYAQGDTSALREVLLMHASTNERLDEADALYDRLFQTIGRPECILDLACGLNPLYLGSKGLKVTGYDIHAGMVSVVNTWATRFQWPVRANVQDLMTDQSFEPAGVALLMKLLPVIEQQKKGAAMQLLASVPAKHQLTTFPTRTLSGRGVGMEQNYTRWFEDHLPNGYKILDRFTTRNELCYITEVTHPHG